METEQIKKFFEENKIPKGFKISSCETIEYPELFLTNNIFMLENSKQVKWQDIYKKRLWYLLKNLHLY
jgi:hypothetical protein